MRLEYKIDPFPAVRSNRNSWSPRTKQYHAKMDKFRALANKDIQTLIDSFISGNYRIIFVIPVAKSWSDKKKQEFIGKPHKGVMDIDNLCKAVFDTIFYQRKENDREISELHARKEWGEEGNISIDIL